MIYCSNCGTEMAESVSFCPNCGSSARPQIPVTAAAVAYRGAVEDKARRVVAYLIDVVPILLLALIHFIPIIGWMFYGALHALYWLLRDISGASLGKTLMGGFVGSESGGVSTTSQRLLRNVPLALPGLVGMVPIVGLPFEFTLALLIFGAEALLLLVTGRRFGDRLANTNVFRKSVA